MIKYRIIAINNCNNAVLRVKEAHILVYIRHLAHLIKAEIIRAYASIRDITIIPITCEIS